MRRLILLGLLWLLPLATSMAQEEDFREIGPVTQAVIDRGALNCGVNGDVVGFSLATETGYVGFDVDICRAVAAAILGDADAVNYIPLLASERAAAIMTGQVDLLSRNTTWTLGRDTQWRATFGPTVFYDGQGLMAFAEDGYLFLEDFEGKTICTNAGTTTESNIRDEMDAIGVSFNLVTFPSFDEVLDAFNARECDAVTSDVSQLLSHRFRQEDPEQYMILPQVISKEPLGPVMSESDPQFADIVTWVVFGLIQAEEYGIDSQNIDDILADPETDIDILRFLGQTEDSQVGLFLGLRNDFMVDVIRQVGNYAEIFERNLAPLGLQRGYNNLWLVGGLLYSPPWR
ncbi:MAG: amino acid ABC transporter substrate-binding protein [Phototrophicales bacterium]